MSYSVLGTALFLCSSSQQNVLKKLSTVAECTSSFHILFSIYNNRVFITNTPLRVTSMLPYSKTILCSFLNTASLQHLTLMLCHLQFLNYLHSLFLKHSLLISLFLVAFFFLQPILLTLTTLLQSLNVGTVQGSIVTMLQVASVL